MAVHRLLRRSAVLVLASVLVTACAGTTTTATPVHPGSAGIATRTEPVHSQAAAAALARLLLAEAALPPGATASAGDPDPALDQAPSWPATADLARATRWARSGLSPLAAQAWFDRHRPHGWTTGGGDGTTSGPTGFTSAFVIDALAGMPEGVVSAQLAYSAAPLPGGGSGVRVDAQVAWVPARLAVSDVPAADRTVVVVRTVPARLGTRGAPTTRRVTVTRPRLVAALRAAVDGLGLSPPGATSCPAEPGTVTVLTFEHPGPDRTYTIGSCNDVTATGAHGRELAVLADDSALDAVVQRVLHHHPHR